MLRSCPGYDSAAILHDQAHYPSVAHCSYYSCYQLFRHIWFYSMGKTESDLKFIIDHSKNKKAEIKGSHDVLIKMTPNEFIISKLQSFIHDFPETRVRYEHDKLSDTHFVEVEPNEVYHLSDKY
ncbi:MAG: hypothetical protein PHG06_12830, partial [Parabacteroides sp.]|nr:hypothetical protein [Parabacteroides sp.]